MRGFRQGLGGTLKRRGKEDPRQSRKQSQRSEGAERRCRRRCAPEDRLAKTSSLLITAFLGLSVPVIGAGVALAGGATALDTVLGFAIAVALGIAPAGGSATP